MFLKNLIEMGGFELVHHWHGIDMLMVLECALLAMVACIGLGIIGGFMRRKRMAILSVIGALSFATAAYAANTQLSLLSASGVIAGANLLYVVQTAGVGGVKATFTQVATFINSLFSGDITVTSGGVATLKNTGPGATGPLGSATVAPIVTIDAQGRTTALSSATITPAIGSVTGLGTGVGTALGTNVGTAGSVVVNGGALGTPSSGTLTSATGLPISTGVSGLGTGVATAAAVSLSGAGGISSTIASGTSALGTGAIASATCATVVTTAATNTATTDVVTASFNGDPTAVTGYVPLTTGMLTIIGYPTLNNVNFKVCNNTSSSITPGAITLNWRVIR